MSSQVGQQHPLGIYYKIWTLLFVLSTLSYMVDYIGVEGYLRWTLILIFMTLKAGFILAVFMHVMWERLALILTILGPPVVLLLLIGFMSIEGDYVFDSRVEYIGQDANKVPNSPHHVTAEAEH
ncbi:MAG: cytochrome C oxidase subunit IV [SAR86 cluster bacterium]|uniref:Cytochrome C oxidase subunit IV n=1 Tax=SAR86 cluster bacterium TaxID=2030880 RepID=A0A2A4MVK3_9GAMM|nr:MAG: cytochrome C oxidase subunit IV [SAR86 cluster bacterium]